MGNTGTIPPHEGEITGSNEDGKISKSDLVAWTQAYRLIKAKLGLQPFLMHSRPNLAFGYNPLQV
jgi:hypothetical protein